MRGRLQYLDRQNLGVDGVLVDPAAPATSLNVGQASSGWLCWFDDVGWTLENTPRRTER